MVGALWLKVDSLNMKGRASLKRGVFSIYYSSLSKDLCIPFLVSVGKCHKESLGRVGKGLIGVLFAEIMEGC